MNWTGSDGNTYNPGGFVMVKAGETVTLTANWNKVAKMVKFRINFKENNPSKTGLTVANMPNPAYLEVEVEEGTKEYTFTLPNNTPAIGNWVFLGWFEKSSIQWGEEETGFKPGATYTVKADKPVVDLYANWGTKASGGQTEDGEGNDY